MKLLCLTVNLAAEPASIIYIVTGAAGLLFARLRTSSQATDSSVVMLFCRRSTREKMAHINLTR
jgi:hypothetical protein